MSGSPAEVHVSAPGKLMLLGEHAVVHRRPCLVTAMDSRLHMTLGLADPGDETFTIEAPDVGVERIAGLLTDVFTGGTGLARGTRFIESSMAVFRKRFGLPRGLRIRTRSDFSSTLGLGSSSATVACTLFGLTRLFGIDLTPLQLFELGLEAIVSVQQVGSGFDLAAAVYGGTLFYDTGVVRRIVPLTVPRLPLVVAYSGVKADTATYVQGVNRLLGSWPAAVSCIFDAMAQLVLGGRMALEAAHWSQFGQLMNMQHGLTHAIGVDIPETAALVFAARRAGAFGAKLSGAGGGDCVIALASDDKRPAVEAALVAAGGQLVPAAPSAPGVREEAKAMRP